MKKVILNSLLLLSIKRNELKETAANVNNKKLHLLKMQWHSSVQSVHKVIAQKMCSYVP